MVLLEFSMYPTDKGESVGDYVSRSLDIIDRSGVDYRLHAMGTVLEGEWDDVIDVMSRCFKRMQEDCHRIAVVAKVDYRKDKTDRLSYKVDRVEKTVGRSLKT